MPSWPSPEAARSSSSSSSRRPLSAAHSQRLRGGGRGHVGGYGEGERERAVQAVSCAQHACTARGAGGRGEGPMTAWVGGRVVVCCPGQGMAEAHAQHARAECTRLPARPPGLAVELPLMRGHERCAVQPLRVPGSSTHIHASHESRVQHWQLATARDDTGCAAPARAPLPRHDGAAPQPGPAVVAQANEAELALRSLASRGRRRGHGPAATLSEAFCTAHKLGRPAERPT